MPRQQAARRTLAGAVLPQGSRSLLHHHTSCSLTLKCGELSRIHCLAKTRHNRLAEARHGLALRQHSLLVG